MVRLEPWQPGSPQANGSLMVHRQQAAEGVFLIYERLVKRQNFLYYSSTLHLTSIRINKTTTTIDDSVSGIEKLERQEWCVGSAQNWDAGTKT